jgi:hypothetical protein
MTMVRISCWLVSFVGCLTLLGCWRLPKDFDSLPLAEQVKAYRTRFQLGGARDRGAESHIASHGYQAAMALVPYVTREKTGIPPFVAIHIIWRVQVRGCTLRGTPPEAALKEFLVKGSPNEDERLTAKLALEAISENLHSSPQDERIPANLCRTSSE